ncbi:MAG: DMP19 family protein [Pseudomonadota bacterium]
MSYSYPEDFDDLYLTVADIDDFRKLSTAQQTGFCINVLEMEVNNGGFHQFFCNSVGYYTPEVLEALGRIGAHKTHSLLSQAIAIAYPTGFPTDRSQHEALLDIEDETVDALAPLDDAFYAYEDNLTDLVNTYLAG